MLIQVSNLVLDYFNLVTTTITLVNIHAYKRNWGGIITILLTLLHRKWKVYLTKLLQVYPYGDGMAHIPSDQKESVGMTGQSNHYTHTLLG